MTKEKKVLVIGGGPAGMLAAGSAGSRGLDVTLVEKNDKLGRKLYITGKGRCNITNDTDVEGLIENVPINSSFLYSAFYTFTNDQLISLLNELGLETKVERGSRIFPVSDESSEVIETLKKYIDQNNVKVLYNEVAEINVEDDKVTGVVLADDREIETDSVIIATGGKSYPQTGSTGDGYRFAEKMGHTITRLNPSLVPLETEEGWVKEAQGLSLRNIEISVYDNKDKKVFEEFGEMLFTHYGVTGPVILSASSHMREIEKKKYRVSIDLKPALSEEKLDRRLQRDFEKYSRKFFGNSLGDLLPKKLISIIVNLSLIPHDKPVNQITKEERKNLVHLLKNLTVHIKKFRPIKDAIVTSGGVEVDEINPSTMESKLVDGLYFAGEVIDVDAYTGGFNLQIAFSTGYLAGLSC